MSVIERQANLVAMVQDAIAGGLESGQDVSGLVVNLKHLVDMLSVLSSLGATTGQVAQRKRVDEGRREEYERDVRRQYARMKQNPVPPTQYVYGDGFQGVTMPDGQQQPRQQDRKSVV